MHAAEIILVIADPKRAAGWLARLRDWPATVRVAHSAEELGAGAVAVGDDPALAGVDYLLSDDASPRELAAAGRLLAEIARLRRDVLEQASAAERLRAAAALDPLTALPHRGTWDDELPRRLAGPTASGHGVAIFDLDRFKDLNDTLGHAAGDSALKQAAAALRAGTRPRDLASRLGGDEFGVLLADVTYDQAAAVVERLRQAMGGPATVSAGFVWIPPNTIVVAEHAVEAADQALRHAKQSGRNQSHASGERGA